MTEKFFNTCNPSQLVHEFFLQVSSNFITEEILSGQTILNFYGGYYDFAAFVKSQLLLRSEYTYFFWEVIWDSHRNPEAKLCVQGLKTRYINDQITECLSWIAPRLDSDNNSIVSKASLHYISSLDTSEKQFKDISSIHLNDLIFNSEYSCHFIVCRDPNGDPKNNKTLTWIKYAEPASINHPVRIENLGDKLHYNWDRNFGKWIEKKAQEMWN